MSDPDELRTLLAERSIERAGLRYARGVDRMDADLVRSAFHPDAVVTMGSFTGTLDEYVALVWKLISRRTMTMHYLTNSLIEFDPSDPSRARAETYGFALQRSENQPPQGNLITGFRYLDVVTERDGTWAIAERTTVSEWARVDDLDGQWPLAPGATPGARDGTDPVVRRWAEQRAGSADPTETRQSLSTTKENP